MLKVIRVVPVVIEQQQASDFSEIVALANVYSGELPTPCDPVVCVFIFFNSIVYNV